MGMCSKCGVELKSGAKFCKACGSGRQEASQHDDKKSRVLAGDKRPGKNVAVIGIVIAVAAAAGVFFAVRGTGDGDGTEQMQAARKGASRTVFAAVAAENGTVRIPLTSLNGAAASHFVYKANGGKDIRFFALRASDGTIRVALDACDACYRSKLGYHQQGDVMVCNNCGLSFRSTDIGIITGGCNPVPLDKKTDRQHIVVQARDLEAGARYF